MTDTVTALAYQLGKQIREYIQSDQQNHAELESLIGKYLKPHIQEQQLPPKTGAQRAPWRPPETIGYKALDIARELELNDPRQGQLYMLAEIVTALHRQAEALESIDQRLSRK